MSSPVNSTDLSWGTLVQLIKCKSVNKPQVAIVFSSLLLLPQLQSQSGVRTQLSQFRFGVDNGSLLNGRPHTYAHSAYNKGQFDTRLQGRTWAEAVKLIATTSSSHILDYVNVTSTLFLLQFNYVCISTRILSVAHREKNST